MAMREPGSGFEYCIGPNDTYASIAKRFALSEKALQMHNTGAEIKPGQAMWIPCAYGCCKTGRFYVIRKGETLLRIARRCGLTLAVLLEANPYLNPAYYVPGQVVVIPKSRQERHMKRYTLEAGEGLMHVLRKFKMDITTFCMLNPGLCPMDACSGMTVVVGDGGVI